MGDDLEGRGPRSICPLSRHQVEVRWTIQGRQSEITSEADRPLCDAHADSRPRSAIVFILLFIIVVPVPGRPLEAASAPDFDFIVPSFKIMVRGLPARDVLEAGPLDTT